MAGTRAGGLKAARTTYQKVGKDFYHNIGKLGGNTGKQGGFASDKVGKDGLTGRERARICGQKGGKLSKRGKARAK